ncbi:MAG: tetratricopeptide repeat protein [Bacteroidota bacterium]
MAENKETNNLDLDKTLVDTTHKVEDFYANNKKQINMAIIAVVVIIGGYVGYKKLIVEPMDIEAQKEIFMAQNYFEMDSFALALNGNEKFKGFEAIAEEYGASKAGNLAHYYAGICNLRTGQYESAIEHLEDFSTENLLIGPLAEGAIGDAYVELGDLDKGVNHYMKAARMSKNKLTSPVFLKKAGMVYEEKQSYVDALEAYQTIKKDFAESQEAQDIDKYIARATALKEGN